MLDLRARALSREAQPRAALRRDSSRESAAHACPAVRSSRFPDPGTCRAGLASTASGSEGCFCPAITKPWMHMASTTRWREVDPVLCSVRHRYVLLRQCDHETVGELLLQKQGIPMGDPVSPGMTIVACAWMERTWLTGLQLPPSCFGCCPRQRHCCLDCCGVRARMRAPCEVPARRGQWSVLEQIGLGRLGLGRTTSHHCSRSKRTPEEAVVNVNAKKSFTT